MYYDRHTAVCMIITRSARGATDSRTIDGSEPIPGPREMFRMLQGLALKCESLETKVATLTTQLRIKSAKIDPIKWLIDTKPLAPTTDAWTWVESIVVSTPEFNRVIDSNIQQGVAEILGNNLDLITAAGATPPIRTVSLNRNTLYVWALDDAAPSVPPTYRTAEPEEWAFIFDVIVQRVLRKFKLWSDTDAKRLDRDQYSAEYCRISKLIVAGNTSRTYKLTTARNQLLKLIAEDPVSLVQLTAEEPAESPG